MGIGIPGLAYQNWQTRIGIHTRIGIPDLHTKKHKKKRGDFNIYGEYILNSISDFGTPDSKVYYGNNNHREFSSRSGDRMLFDIFTE